MGKLIGCENDGEWTFLGSSVHVSRKQRKCHELRFVEIQPGDPYYAAKSVCDGEFDVFVQSMKAFHLCRALHQKFAIKHGYSECVIPFGGLSEVEPDDLYEYFGFDFERDAPLLRALKWAKILCSRFDPYKEHEQLGPVTDEDWKIVTELSVAYAPHQDVKFDAIGQRIVKNEEA